MTFNETMDSLNGAKIQAVLDGCGDTADIALYKINADDFAEDVVLDWPTDWPQWVSVKFLQDLGIEVITA